MDEQTNADAAIKAWGGKPDFASLNHEKGDSWKGTEGNSDAAIGEFGGVRAAGCSSSIRHHGSAELPSNKDDSPKADNGQTY